jgi:diguanylate cyclase (GGDEF)-like protein/PAS domain S-box-containing protein
VTVTRQAAPPEAPPIDGADVHARMVAAEETLRAIRHGEVDALVVREASPAAQVFTLSSADRPYRMFVENMRDGAATVSESGIVLYANRRLAEMLTCPLEYLMGSPIASFIADGDRRALRAISGRAGAGGTIEADLLTHGGERIPVRVNTSTLDVDGQQLLCITFGDLTEQHAQMREIDRLGCAQAARMRELEQAQAELTKQATHDALTGLPNRNLIIDRITQALALGRRSGKSTGVIFVDLDRFKEINDSRGHAAGDSVLREVGKRLAIAVRSMDSVSRIGGDEFVVLLPVLATSLDAIDVGQRITAIFDMPFKLDHGSVSVTASIGISVSDDTLPDRDPNEDGLLHQADTAMYYAKSLGGSNTELFDPGRTPAILGVDRETWVARIREALDEDRFVLYAQPIVELATGTVVKRELLLRMLDRDGHVIPPMAFLPAAETYGLIGEIDQWVITQATKLTAGGQSVAVNLSAASAGDPAILDVIERELRHHEADPGNLVFEITETAVMQNMDRARMFAERLVALGCHFALDDFGTGFASFTYLKRLPAHYLKIDIDFVRALPSSNRDRSIVKAIVALAEDFGQRTIAEGVEDERTAEVLRSLGVTLAQGYLFGRPRPIADQAFDAALAVA